MILNAKGWVWIALIALFAGTLSYTIYKLPAQIFYEKGKVEARGVEVTPTPTPVIPQVVVGTTVVNVRVASTSAQVSKGLSGTLTMAPNEGMIFLFPVSDKYRFWMPDMHFGLDMIWIGANKKVVDITRNAPPLKDITKPVFYSPKVPAKYVLEVNANWSNEHQIKIGDTVEFKSL